MKRIFNTLFIMSFCFGSYSLAQDFSGMQKKLETAKQALPPEVQKYMTVFVVKATPLKKTGKDSAFIATQQAEEFSGILPATVEGQKQRFASIKFLNNTLTPNQHLRTFLGNSLKQKPNTVQSAQLEKLELEVVFVTNFTTVLMRDLSNPPSKKK